MRENLEKNVARLVKRTGRSDVPSPAFTESVVNQAIGELSQGAHAEVGARGDGAAKRSRLRVLACAALFLLAAGVIVALSLPSLNVVKYSSGQRAEASKEALVHNNGSVSAGSSVASSVVSSGPTREHRLSADASRLEEAVRKVVISGDAVHVTDGHARSMSGSLQSASAVPTEASAATVSGREVGMGMTGNTVALADGSVSPGEPASGLRSDSVRVAQTQLSMYGGEAANVPAREGARSLVGRKTMEVKPVRTTHPMAHGGTTPPNGEPADAMFFKSYGVNPFIDTEDDRLSTFATDVDTGSYTVARRYLHEGHLPPREAVRVEEFVNYFDYGYPAPQENVFKVYMEAAPWSFGQGRKNSYLLRIGLKARQVSDEGRQPAILTFVIDVSGSMGRENRLGLVKKSLRMLVENLRPEDRIGIAVYGRRGRKAMEHQGLDEKDDILAAIESLRADGSTNAEEGLRIGYQMAEHAYRRGCANRVILCSDGVANVGLTAAADILKVIQDKADRGIMLSAIGFGMGNYNDVLLERLGDKGNGHYAYVDTITEAKRIFERDLTSLLEVVAREVKVQVDFNSKVVRSYRLIGYENRDVPDEKFRDDKYDGGEVGAGHAVTALYELKLWPDRRGSVATTRVRHKDADSGHVSEFEESIVVKDLRESFDDATIGFKLAATVAEFAEILRESHWARGASLDAVLKRAQQTSRELEDDARVIELVDLIARARRLTQEKEADATVSELSVDVFEEP